MKPTNEQIDQIRSAFAALQSRKDLLNLLNQVKPILYGDKCIPFTLRQLTYYSFANTNKIRYKSFTIKKKSGAERTIHAPVNGLKAIQKCLSIILQCVFNPHVASFGFAWDRSIVDNANLHAGNNYVYNIDLKDFFPSVEQARIWKCLQLAPFDLKGRAVKSTSLISWSDYFATQPDAPYYKPPLSNFEIELKGWSAVHLIDNSIIFYKTPFGLIAETRKGKIIVDRNFNKEKAPYLMPDPQNRHQFRLVNKDHIDQERLVIANMIAALCCTEMEVSRLNGDGAWVMEKRNVLPQGAPTSPVMTNIVCQRLDFLLTSLAKRFGLQYSRYADDITFSSMHNVYQSNSVFINELRRIIDDQHFTINETKTRLQGTGHRQEVTGLLVNQKANVQKRYIKQIRQWLYYWERYGYERAYGYFLQKYFKDKGHNVKGKPDMRNVIAGKLDFLKMVKGEEDAAYTNLTRRFLTLTGKTKPSKDRDKHLNTVLDLFISNGLNAAMKYYKPLES